MRKLFEQNAPPDSPAAQSDGAVWKNTGAEPATYFVRRGGTWVRLPDDVVAVAVGTMIDEDVTFDEAIDRAIASEAAQLGEHLSKFREWALRLSAGGKLEKDVVDFGVGLVVSARDRAERARAQKKEISAVCDARVREAEERTAFVLGIMGEARVAEYVKANANKGKKTLILPAGTVKVSARKGAPELADEEALRDWLTINGLTEFLEPQPDKIKWGELKKAIDSPILGGQIPDGVQWTEDREVLAFDGGSDNG